MKPIISLDKFEVLWHDGVKAEDIAAIFNVKTDTVYKFAHRHNLAKRKPGTNPLTRNEAKREWLIKNYPHMRNEVCATFLGYSPDYIGKVARKLGLKKSQEYMDGIRAYHIKRVRETRHSQICEK